MVVSLTFMFDCFTLSKTFLVPLIITNNDFMLKVNDVKL